MRMNVYTIFDTATGAYMRPFFLLADSQAIRSFKDITLDADHEVGRHPEDYSLVRIGTFDDQEGTLHPENVTVLTTGLAMKAASRQIDTQKMEALQQQIALGDGADSPANGETRGDL